MVHFAIRMANKYRRLCSVFNVVGGLSLVALIPRVSEYLMLKNGWRPVQGDTCVIFSVLFL